MSVSRLRQGIRDFRKQAFSNKARIVHMAHLPVHGHLELDPVAGVQGNLLSIIRLTVKRKITMVFTPDYGFLLLWVAPKYYAKHHPVPYSQFLKTVSQFTSFRHG